MLIEFVEVVVVGKHVHLIEVVIYIAVVVQMMAVEIRVVVDKLN